MRIFIASDLHFEFHNDGWLPDLPTHNDCDLIILAGDISVGNNTILAIERVYQATGLPIVWVAGNHEYYSRHLGLQECAFRRQFSQVDYIHFLERDRVRIEGITFLGCTLWTGFNCLGDSYKSQGIKVAESCLSDFNQITIDDGRGFTPLDAVTLYKDSCRWIEDQLKESAGSKSVVITHFPPTRSIRNHAIPEDIMSTYFQADCEYLIQKYQPDCWFYGHNHWSDDQYLGNSRLVSNQRGYPNEEGIPAYEIKIVEV